MTQPRNRIHRNFARLASAIALLTLFVPAFAEQPAPFQFESVPSLEAMEEFIRTTFPLGSPKGSLEKAFVQEGGATYRRHPQIAKTEKYLYDINLCNVYIWRWNISADYDDSGNLLQAYVNGEPVHAGGRQKTDPKLLPNAGKAAIFKMNRPRPEAYMGEKVLSYIMLDGDADTRTVDDQFVMGGGPTQPNPVNMGRLHVYMNVDPWRSIFDPDPADRIVEYPETCPSSK